MTTHLLPQDIIPEQGTVPSGIIFFDYIAQMGSFKGKSILQTNAISLVLSGKKTMHFADKSIHITDDEFHFLSSGNCLASMELSKQEYFRSILIFFDNRILDDFRIKYRSLFFKSEQAETQHYLSFKKDAFVFNYINSLKLLFDANGQISPEMSHLKFEELMLHLLKKYPDEILSFHTGRNRDFDDVRFRSTVEGNVHHNITIGELAFLCNTSLSTFSRRFSTLYGTSPSKWLLKRRMEMATNLLVYHQEKPADVYYKVGYQNHSSFSKSFRQTFGMSPSEFQLQNMTD
jgi:AraC-like DNA-binding protein